MTLAVIINIISCMKGFRRYILMSDMLTKSETCFYVVVLFVMKLCNVVYFPLCLSCSLPNVVLNLISWSYEIKAGLSLAPPQRHQSVQMWY